MGERRSRATNQTNTQLNSRQANYQNTRNSITGLCERSVADHFNTIETAFIEKYLKYMVQDEFTGMFFKLAPYNKTSNNNNSNNNPAVPGTRRSLRLQNQNSIDDMPQNTSKSTQQEAENVFYSLRPFRVLEFWEEMRLQLKQRSTVSSNELVMESVNGDAVIESNQLVVIESGLKLTHEKLRYLVSSKLEFLSEQLERACVNIVENQIVHLIVFYNGDVNFDFNIEEYMSERRFTTDSGISLVVQVHVAYISKLAILQHFAQKNRYNIDAIDDKLITFYELARFSLKSRQKQLKIAQSQQNQQVQQQNNADYQFNLQKQSQQQLQQQQAKNAIIQNKQKLLKQSQQEQPNPSRGIGDFKYLKKRLQNYASNSMRMLRGRPMLSALFLSVGTLSLVFLIKRIWRNKVVSA